VQGAGSEAAANLGSKTLLITMSLQNIAQMSCNPAMGELPRVKLLEDALGGYSGIVSDRTAIQFKMLNKSKGPAMGRLVCSQTGCVLQKSGG
jgi:tRNA uridine 5-carboxymethylaminomethyl modification enzyme